MANRTHVVMAHTYWNVGHRKACTNIVQYWPGLGRETDIFCHQATKGLKGQWKGPLRSVTPTVVPDPIVARLERRVPRRWFNDRLTSTLSRVVARGDLVLAWPGTPTRTVKLLKEMGATVAVEFINTHCQYSYEILQREFDKLGLTYTGKITPERIGEDDNRIREADIIFCPNRFVEESVLRAGPAEGKIISSPRGTYLRDGQMPRTRREGVFTFVFVGEFGVRKGAPYLLEGMKALGSSARLLVAGRIAPEMKGWMAERGAPDNITFLGFVKTIADVYAEADALLFPSLEEGGPKVCYEAAAWALPMIVTEMGGGRIAKDGETGYVVPPSDPEALTDAMRRMAADREGYLEMSRTVLERVKGFSWDAIARDRHEKLLARGV